jgi:capsular exopolysaccharide synthesis family protein
MAPAAAFPAAGAAPTRDEVWDQPAISEALLNPLLVAATDPGSPAAEQYRLLRTRLEGHDDGRRTRLIVVTSPALGEGKTTTSANLALTIAQEVQHSVVLVEADLRRPRLAELFGVRAEPGLADVLVGAATLEDALVAVPGHPLVLLPAGLAGPRSAGLLEASVVQRTLDLLRGRFDRIIIDAAPMALADTHVLTRLADGILLVVRAGVTPRPALERALEGVDRQRVMGVVLNDVDDTPVPYDYPGAPAQGTGR